MQKIAWTLLMTLVVVACVEQPERWKPDGTPPVDNAGQIADGRSDLIQTDASDIAQVPLDSVLLDQSDNGTSADLPDVPAPTDVHDLVDLPAPTDAGDDLSDTHLDLFDGNASDLLDSSDTPELPEVTEEILDVTTELSDLPQEDPDLEEETVDLMDEEEVCQPDCLDKECGDDGCGGNCGDCDIWSGLSCQNSVCICTATPQVDFDKFYKRGDEDYAYTISLDSDGNYVVGGDSYGSSIVRNFHLLRVSPNGNQFCSQYLPGSGTNRVRALWPMDNGIMALAGTHSSPAGGFPNKWDFGFLLSLSAPTACNMNKDSLEYFGGSNIEEAFDMKPLPGGSGFVLVGYRQTTAEESERDMWIVLTDVAGVPQLPGFQHGEAGRQEAHAVVVANDGFVVAGFSHASGQALLVKFDPSGNLVWERELGQGEAHDVQSIDGGYAVGGHQTGEESGDDAHLWLTNSDGEIVGHGEWAGEGNDRGYGLTKHPSGGFVLVGDTTTNAIGGRDGFIARFSASGFLMWNANIGGTMEDYPRDVLVDSSNRIVLAGYADHAADYNFSKTDFWVVRYKPECE